MLVQEQAVLESREQIQRVLPAQSLFHCSFRFCVACALPVNQLLYGESPRAAFIIIGCVVSSVNISA